MILSFDKISDESRVWIFQSSHIIPQSYIESLEIKIENFLKTWTSHGNKLVVSYKIKYNLFIIIALDQSQSSASGCSIDKLVIFIKKLEEEFSVRLLDRLDISYKHNNIISVIRLDHFKRKIFEKKIDNSTIVFNNLIKLKSDLENNWEVPLANSWHKQLIK
tara:strand:- start:227 stop:712 length:486 start_codon:yes stop_codon:yes gene_type:complete